MLGVKHDPKVGEVWRPSGNHHLNTRPLFYIYSHTAMGIWAVYYFLQFSKLNTLLTPNIHKPTTWGNTLMTKLIFYIVLFSYGKSRLTRLWLVSHGYSLVSYKRKVFVWEAWSECWRSTGGCALRNRLPNWLSRPTPCFVEPMSACVA